MATKSEASELKAKYLAGNFGYGHAKNELFSLILEKFREPREKFDYLMSNTHLIIEKLETGEAKARKVAQSTLERIRPYLGFD